MANSLICKEIWGQSGQDKTVVMLSHFNNNGLDSSGHGHTFTPGSLQSYTSPGIYGSHLLYCNQSATYNPLNQAAPLYGWTINQGTKAVIAGTGSDFDLSSQDWTIDISFNLTFLQPYGAQSNAGPSYAMTDTAILTFANAANDGVYIISLIRPNYNGYISIKGYGVYGGSGVNYWSFSAPSDNLGWSFGRYMNSTDTYKMAIVKSGTSVNCWVNGYLYSTFGEGTFGSTNKLYIGTSINNYSSYFNINPKIYDFTGKIDEFRFSKIARHTPKIYNTYEYTPPTIEYGRLQR